MYPDDETLLKTLRFIKEISKRTIDYKKGIEEERQELNKIKKERIELKNNLQQILISNES